MDRGSNVRDPADDQPGSEIDSLVSDVPRDDDVFEVSCEEQPTNELLERFRVGLTKEFTKATPDLVVLLSDGAS